MSRETVGIAIIKTFFIEKDKANELTDHLMVSKGSKLYRSGNTAAGGPFHSEVACGRIFDFILILNRIIVQLYISKWCEAQTKK